MNGSPPTVIIDRLTEGLAEAERLAKEKPETVLAVARPAEQQIRGLFDVEVLGTAMSANSWSAEHEMQLLISIASDPKENTRSRLAAAAMIRANAEKALVLTGKIAKVQARRTVENVDGTGKVIEEVHQTKLAGVAEAASRKLLEAIPAAEEVIEAQETQNAESPETTADVAVPGPDADRPAKPGYGADDHDSPTPTLDAAAGSHPATGSAGPARPSLGGGKAILGEPERDLGGGGLCASAQRDARDARRRAAVGGE